MHIHEVNSSALSLVNSFLIGEGQPSELNCFQAEGQEEFFVQRTRPTTKTKGICILSTSDSPDER